MRRQAYSVWYLQLGIVAALSAGVAALPADNSQSCENINCATDCHVDSKSYQPQRCGRCCNDLDEAADSLTIRLDALEGAVLELRVMTGFLLGLVMLLVFGLLLHLAKNLPQIYEFPAFFRRKKPQPNCNGTIGNSTISSRLADHQSNSSPSVKRASVTGSTLGNTDLEPEPRPLRVRQPSESTCPEEGNDITPQGYDNFALSTSTINSSTLHNTSDYSTDTLGPALSTNTVQTTLASENHINGNTRV